MDQLIEAFSSNPGLLVGVILGLAGMASGVAIFALISQSAHRSTKERELTRRELAAYVAEGTISSEDAERLLSPSPWWVKKIKVDGKDVRSCVREHLGV